MWPNAVERMADSIYIGEEAELRSQTVFTVTVQPQLHVVIILYSSHPSYHGNGTVFFNLKKERSRGRLHRTPYVSLYLCLILKESLKVG